MALYESTIILRPDLATSDVEKITGEFEELIAANGGKVVLKDLWGLRDFSYKIHKNKKGYYIFFGIEGGSETIAELRRKYKLNEDVIRDLTVKVEKINKDSVNLGDKN
jgi:small subunit ribosomal protein S6